MRQSVRDSIAAGDGAESYPAGSIVLCQSCLKPLYRLERGIGVGESAAKSVDAYRPVRPQDVYGLMEAIDPGVATMARLWTVETLKAHCHKIPELRTGSPAVCPCCGNSFVRVRAVEAAEVIDRAYVMELVTIPPGRQLRGREVRAWAQ